MEARGFSKAEAQASNPTVPRSVKAGTCGGVQSVMADYMQVWDLLVQRDGDTLAMSGSGAFATNKDIGAYHLRTLLKAANVDDVEAAIHFIQGNWHPVMLEGYTNFIHGWFGSGHCIHQICSSDLKSLLPAMQFGWGCRRG